MLELKQHATIKKSSEKSFGIVFSLFFFILSIFPIFFQKQLNVYFLLIALVVIFFAFFKPIIFFYPNKICWLNFSCMHKS